MARDSARYLHAIYLRPQAICTAHRKKQGKIPGRFVSQIEETLDAGAFCSEVSKKVNRAVMNEAHERGVDSLFVRGSPHTGIDIDDSTGNVQAFRATYRSRERMTDSKVSKRLWETSLIDVILEAFERRGCNEGFKVIEITNRLH